MSDRYESSLSPEGQYQPGSGGEVLLNKLGITNPDEMDNIEFDFLAELQDQLFNEIRPDSRISVSDLCEWHKRWLGNIYDWAGRYRTVNMEKDGFLFAAAHLLSKNMDEYENQVLNIYTPCEGIGDSKLIDALAICHVEFVILHPFREGNGRLARLLATVMALQADKPPLNFEIMNADKNRYIAAIHAGHSGDYQPMKQLFAEVLNSSIQ